jgi:acyl dehydratase
VIHNTTTLRDQASGEVIAYAHSTSIARADGGFGGPRGPEEPKQAIPDTPPDKVCDLPTYPNAGLLYRLAALDYNPLHSDPAFARRAGFDRPILHGRCTYAIACHAILREVCGYDPGRLRSMRARFSAPVYPGETIRTEMWVDGRIVTFRSTIPARGGVVVLDNGRAELNG